jgi:hypothetical protein
MTIKLAGFDNTPFTPQRHASAAGDRFIQTYLLAVLSGSYVTGGDLLDLSNNNGASPSYPNTIPFAVGTGLVGIDIMQRGPTGGFTGLGGLALIVPPNADTPMTFADVLLLKLKLLVVVGTEYTAGAYGAGVTGDEITLRCTWAR